VVQVLPDTTPPFGAVHPKTVRARHAASLIVLRRRAGRDTTPVYHLRKWRQE
jgi:hypothetical protein